MVLETLVKKRPQLVHPPFGLGEQNFIPYKKQPKPVIRRLQKRPLDDGSPPEWLRAVPG